MRIFFIIYELPFLAWTAKAAPPCIFNTPPAYAEGIMKIMSCHFAGIRQNFNLTYIIDYTIMPDIKLFEFKHVKRVL